MPSLPAQTPGQGQERFCFASQLKLAPTPEMDVPALALRPADGVPPTPTPQDLTSFPCNRTEHWEGWNPTQGPRTLHCPARLCTLNAPFIPRLHVPLSPTFPMDGMFVPPDSCARALTRTVMVLGVGPLEHN